MRLWQRRRVDVRTEQWLEFARELELEESGELIGRLKDHLDLGEGALDPVYALRRPGQPHLVLFDQHRERSGPTGVVKRLRTCVLVRTVTDTLPVSWRASARRNSIVESLEASRSGGVRLELAEDPGFDGRISVYARDAAAVRAVLVPAVRGVLLKLLEPFDGSGRDAVLDPYDLPRNTSGSANLVVGARSLLLWAEPDEPLPMGKLIDLTTGMLSLYAALNAAVEGGDPTP
ncbi:MAG: hypothetical protein KF813_12350 [Trueperaceae bacterium]|nr:hypothetical protein [Trueperaceae bacterium]